MKPTRMWLGVSVATLSLTAAGAARAGATISYDSLYSYVDASASNHSKSQSDDTYSYSGLSSLATSVTYSGDFAHQGSPGATFSGQEDASFSVSGPTSGVFSSSGVATSQIAYSSVNSAFSFELTTTDTETLQVAFSDLHSPDQYGNTDFNFYEIDPVTSNYVSILTGGASNGGGSKNVTFGPGTYYFSAYESLDISPVGSGSATGSHNDTLSFSISAAPEPGTWVLMMAGVGLAGAALRRRRATAALAA